MDHLILKQRTFTFFLVASMSLLLSACDADVDLASSKIETRPESRTQDRWAALSQQQRIAAAEEIGEVGARKLAASRGWKVISDGTNSSFRHGFDQVYQDWDGRIHVVEAKGGNSSLGRGYGYLQGSSEWAIKSASKTLRSPLATNDEKTASRLILAAAKSEKMSVHVVRTQHVFGVPQGTKIEKTTVAATASELLAIAEENDIKNRLFDRNALNQHGARELDQTKKSRSPVVSAVSSSKPIVVEGNRTRLPSPKGVTKVLGAVGVAADLAFRAKDGMEVEEQFERGEISQERRMREHAKNGGGFGGGLAGALGGGILGGQAGGAVGTCIAPGIGTTIVGVIGTAAGSVVGYIGGEAAVEASVDWLFDKVEESGNSISGAASNLFE